MFKSIATAAVLTVSFTGAAMAEEGFKASEFLNWPAQSQRAYISAAATAAGVIANMNRDGQAKCIDEWGAKYSAAIYPPVIEAMKKMPEYHPMAVTIAVMQKECGPFKYATASAALQ